MEHIFINRENELKFLEDLDAEKVFDELKRKSELVGLNKNQREEIFAIFAKSFAKKSRKVTFSFLIRKILQNF